MYLVIAAGTRKDSGDPAGPAMAHIQAADTAGRPTGHVETVPLAALADTVVAHEARGTARWVWDDTAGWYPALLEAGVRVDRCHDLRLCGTILAGSEYTAGSGWARHAETAAPDDRPRRRPPGSTDQFALFDDTRNDATLEDVLEALASQLAAVAGSAHPGRLRLLLAAESAGSLAAAEMQHAGVPWRVEVHEAILAHSLGPRPASGSRPAALQRLGAEIANRLGAAPFNPDSPHELLRALHRAGIEAETTRQWELEHFSHPAIDPLLEYKRLSRLWTANGWTWLDTWVHGGRFRPEYVVGGVVSGRWASRGGGALQIPAGVRDAVRPDPGHRLIVADAAQLEPRVLAALARDSSLARAASGGDLYANIAEDAFDGDRARAKTALLGAMYGATTGEAGQLLPRLRRAYPQAVAFVEDAATAGEAGRVVSSALGRTCPPPDSTWRRAAAGATAEQERKGRTLARSRGRFTRNFVVQATAAEWASCWLAELRRRLRDIGPRNGELVFFLHDEVVVHARQDRVPEASLAVSQAAAAASTLMFGPVPIDFPVSLDVVDSYADVK